MTPTAEWHLDARQLGRRVLVYDETDSTSSRCADLAGDPGNHGTAVLAGVQTVGRGQHGRTWLCDPGDGILMSVLLFPPPELRRPAVLTAWAAVAVCELIRAECNVQARIKWPNDVLIRGRKVCGILIEQGQGVVAGMGLNLNQSEASLRGQGLAEAGSLACFTGETYDRDETARRLLRRLDDEYCTLLDGDLATLESCWKWRLGLLGREVVVEGHARNHAGRLLDVTFDAVVLEGPSGEPLLLPPETVRHVWPVSGGGAAGGAG